MKEKSLHKIGSSSSLFMCFNHPVRDSKIKIMEKKREITGVLQKENKTSTLLLFSSLSILSWVGFAVKRSILVK